MALRAFRSNPGLGGFGGESSSVAIDEQDCDAFAQIVKELVDNAVDACSASSSRSSSTEAKRVRVTIERVNEDKTSDDDDSYLLEVTVTDNGSGMLSIQDCVEAFRTSKAQGKDEEKTAGRYGIGLTLCLLHAQRLVPNHYATITSATAKQRHFVKASYVVDTEGDKVQCVKRERLPKNASKESGTAVKLLIPGGAVSEQAWPRLAEYFSRFQLSLGLQCSLEVKAPVLATMPLFVKSQQERRSKWNTITHERPWNENITSDNESIHISSPKKQSQKSKEEEETRKEIQIAASEYLRKSIELKNVAHSQQNIRNPAANGRYPILEVDMVIFAPNEDQSDDDSESESDTWIPLESRTATMALIRMVNRVPLLDSAEASACGLVQGITSRASIWNAFGLNVTKSNERARKEALHKGRSFVPYFTVKDSDHVAPFFERGTHSRFEDGSDMESESEDDSGGRDDTENIHTRNKRKQKGKRKVILLPAHIRLGNILLLVQINADPTTLPLPTLSKGRLPLNNESIDKALERGITACLRSLQITNPALLLTCHQLKTTVRDTRYIPSVAAALAGITCKSKNKTFQDVVSVAAREWEKEDESIENGDSQLAIRVGSLGPALERRLRLVCIQSAHIKSRGNATRQRKKVKDSGDKESESDSDENESNDSQELTQVITDITPTKIVKKSRRGSIDSWDSGMSCASTMIPNPERTVSELALVERRIVNKRKEDDYDDEDWL